MIFRMLPIYHVPGLLKVKSTAVLVNAEVAAVHLPRLHFGSSHEDGKLSAIRAENRYSHGIGSCRTCDRSYSLRLSQASFPADRNQSQRGQRANFRADQVLVRYSQIGDPLRNGDQPVPDSEEAIPSIPRQTNRFPPALWYDHYSADRIEDSSCRVPAFENERFAKPNFACG